MLLQQYIFECATNFVLVLVKLWRMRILYEGRSEMSLVVKLHAISLARLLLSLYLDVWAGIKSLEAVAPGQFRSIRVGVLEINGLDHSTTPVSDPSVAAIPVCWDPSPTPLKSSSPMSASTLSSDPSWRFQTTDMSVLSIIYMSYIQRSNEDASYVSSHKIT